MKRLLLLVVLACTGLSGAHNKQTPFQSVGLELRDVERDFAFAGSLKR